MRALNKLLLSNRLHATSLMKPVLPFITHHSGYYVMSFSLDIRRWSICFVSFGAWRLSLG